MHKRAVDDMERFCKEEWSQIPFSVFYTLIRCYGRLSAVLLTKAFKVLNAGVPIIAEGAVHTFGADISPHTDLQLAAWIFTAKKFNKIQFLQIRLSYFFSFIQVTQQCTFYPL